MGMQYDSNQIARILPHRYPFALVDRIEIGETKKTGSMRICDVKVFYRYVGNVDEALTSENRDVV